MAATGEIYSEKQINYPTGGNMLFEYTGLSGSRIGASFIQPETTTNHDGRPPDSLPGSTNWRSTMKTTKTFATALMFSLAALGAAAHASPTSNRTTCRSRASTARRMKARAAPRCRPSWPRQGRRQGGRPGLERRAQRHALRRRLRHSVQRPQPRPGRSRSGQRQDRRPGVERRTTTCRSPASITANESPAGAARLARNEQPSPCCISPPAVPGRHFCPAASARQQRITGTWPRSRQV